MAGDWIKMRTDLYRHPKVCVMADLLADDESELARYVDQQTQSRMTVTPNVTRNTVVGALVSVWGVFRHRGKRLGDDLVVADVPLGVIDDVADLPGFGEVLAAVGWVKNAENSLVFSNFFEELNQDPRDTARAKAAERQRKYRERQKQKRNVIVTSRNAPRDREEKRREETTTSSLSEALRPPDGVEVVVVDFDGVKEEVIGEAKANARKIQPGGIPPKALWRTLLEAGVLARSGLPAEWLEAAVAQTVAQRKHGGFTKGPTEYLAGCLANGAAERYRVDYRSVAARVRIPVDVFEQSYLTLVPAPLPKPEPVKPLSDATDEELLESREALREAREQLQRSKSPTT